MAGTLRFEIRRRGDVLQLDYDLLVEEIPGGFVLQDRESYEEAVLWDVEVAEVVKVGGGPTPLTAVLLAHLIDEKFGYEN